MSGGVISGGDASYDWVESSVQVSRATGSAENYLEFISPPTIRYGRMVGPCPNDKDKVQILYLNSPKTPVCESLEERTDTVKGIFKGTQVQGEQFTRHAFKMGRDSKMPCPTGQKAVKFSSDTSICLSVSLEWEKQWAKLKAGQSHTKAEGSKQQPSIKKK